ncbi:MAG: hypothetical protein HYV77_01790 [Candidatus Wildermuthbacteria bacterium]|nr:hypothetical protein [Candidatus Wildermuthbacteria bacterium]
MANTHGRALISLLAAYLPKREYPAHSDAWQDAFGELAEQFPAIFDCFEWSLPEGDLFYCRDLGEWLLLLRRGGVRYISEGPNDWFDFTDKWRNVQIVVYEAGVSSEMKDALQRMALKLAELLHSESA